MIKKCIKEGNPILEALGNGIQHIGIRKTGSPKEKYALYPTDFYLKYFPNGDCFKDDYKDFAIENLEYKRFLNQRLVKYYIVIEDVIRTNSKNIELLSEFHIWTDEHVKTYLKDKLNKNQEYFIWFGRVYEFKDSKYRSSGSGTIHGTLKNKLSSKGSKPVLTDEQYDTVKTRFYEVINELNSTQFNEEIKRNVDFSNAPEIQNNSYVTNNNHTFSNHDDLQNSQNMTSGIDLINHEIKLNNDMIKNNNSLRNMIVFYNQYEEAMINNIKSLINSSSNSLLKHITNDLLNKLGYICSLDDLEIHENNSIEGIINQDSLGFNKIYVNIIKTEDIIQRSDINNFVRTMVMKNIDKGILCVTSDFDNVAIKYTQKQDNTIVLVNGDQLAKLILENDVITYSKKTYEIKELDLNYINNYQ